MPAGGWFERAFKSLDGKRFSESTRAPGIPERDAFEEWLGRKVEFTGDGGVRGDLPSRPKKFGGDWVGKRFIFSPVVFQKEERILN